MLPLLYHTHHSANKEDIPFWLELANQWGTPILELGCGTGRVLIPLAQAGYTMYGVDNDPEMLACLHQNLNAAALPADQVFIVEADMTSLALAKTFPLVILPCNTFSTLTPTARQATLTSVYALLDQGGRFAISMPNPVMLLELPRRSEAEVEDTFSHPLTGNPVQVLSAWQRTRTHFIVTWLYEHLLPDGRVERVSTEAKHWLTPGETILREIDAAGLVIEAIYGDFKGTEYDPEADNMIIVCTKAE